MKPLRSKPFTGNALAQVITYLRVDLGKAFSDLFEGLRHLRFEDNFDHFYWTGTINSSTTMTIPNRLGSLTLKWWIVRVVGDTRLVERAVTRDIIEIHNNSATDTTATLLFLR